MCWHFACLQMSTLYILPSCIIAGALSMFSTQGWVPDIRPLGSASRNTVPREQEVYHVLHDIFFEDYAIQYHPCCQLISRNTSLQCGEY